MDSAAACGSAILKDFVSLSLFLIAISLSGMYAAISLRFIVMQLWYHISVAIHCLLSNPTVAHCPPGLSSRVKQQW